MIGRIRLVVSIMMTLYVVEVQAREPDIFVSPAGNDVWSGRFAEPLADGSDGPLATLAKAKEWVAKHRRKGPRRDSPILVSIRGGIYYLDQTLKFGPEDSGTDKSPTIYEAFPGERPVLSGGVRIRQWHITTTGHWQTKLADVKAGEWSFTQLFVNDQRRPRARLPKKGYYKIAEGLGRNQFRFANNEIRDNWQNPDDVEILVFHTWSTSRLFIASVASEDSRVVFHGRAWEKFAKGNRYLVENVREALSEPGQWYLDRSNGLLTYIPKSGEQPDKSVIIAPRLERLVLLQGDFERKRWVRNIQFRGLSFAHTNWTLSPSGQSFPQSEAGLDSAIIATGARDILFENIAVRHVGGYGLAFGWGSKNNRVTGCELVDLGGGGVKIGYAGVGSWSEVKRAWSDPDMKVSHHVVRNCLIAHGGRLHPSANGIWIGNSSHNTVEHNEIMDFYYSGISVGWSWGYGHSEAHHNIIGYNHVHAIGQNVLSDMGGIYTLGIQPGTIIHDNHIHNIAPFSYGGWGLYADEGSTDITMEGNLVHDTMHGGFHQHYGRENHIRNNIFAFANSSPIDQTKPDPHISFYFEKNIVYWDNNSPLLGRCHKVSACRLSLRMNSNVYWNTDGRTSIFPGGANLDEWQKKSGQDLNSKIADPLFEAPSNRNFQLKPSSPALKLGFKPLDMKRVGRQLPIMLTKDLPKVLPTFP